MSPNEVASQGYEHQWLSNFVFYTYMYLICIKLFQIQNEALEPPIGGRFEIELLFTKYSLYVLTQ